MQHSGICGGAALPVGAVRVVQSTEERVSGAKLRHRLPGGFLVERVAGSPTAVIGLPLAETVALLEDAGFPLPWVQR